MKKFLLLAFLLSTGVFDSVFGQMAALDSTFGINGYVEVPMGTGTDEGVAIALQPDGKMVVAGKVQVGSGLNYDFGVMRLWPDGSLDSSFSADGKVVTPVGNGIDEPAAVALDGNGRIYVAGQSDNGSNYDFAIVRYLPDGALDTTFNHTGKLQRDGSGGFDFCSGMALQPDGKIVLVGYAFINNGYHGLVMRVNPDGSRDTGFGTNGLVTLSFPNSNEELYAISLQTDGKILVGGNSTTNSTTFSLSVIRLNTNGSLDLTFDTDGMATVMASLTNNTCTRLHALPDGKIIATGNGAAGTTRNFLAVRLTAAGGLDQGYGNNGFMLLGFGSGDNFCYDSALLPDGKLLMAGTHYNGATLDLGIIKLDANGFPDLNFTSNGTLTTDLAGNKDIAHAIAVQPDQKILLAGTTENANFQFMVARYTAGIITSLADGGIYTSAKAFPNPFHGNLQVEFPISQSSEVRVELLDRAGRILLSKSEWVIVSGGMGRVELVDLEELPAGLYFVRILTPGGKWTARAVKVGE